MLIINLSFCNQFNASFDYILGLSDYNIVSKKHYKVNREIVSKRLKQIRRRKKAIRQFKLIRIKKIKLYHTLKKINKQKEKQIYINEKQKQIKLYNKNLKRENKNIKLENINVIKDTNKIINTEIKVFNNMIKLMSENIDCKPANQDPAIPAIDNM